MSSGDALSSWHYHQRGYANTYGSLCTNNINFDGFVFGNFKCPIEGFEQTAVACCGVRFKEYCCEPRASDQAKSIKTNTDVKNMMQRLKSQFNSIAASVFISLLLISCILGAIAFFRICKRRVHYEICPETTFHETRPSVKPAQI
jgi:hypothetical protein